MLNTLSIIGANYLFIAIAGMAFVYFLKQPRGEQKRLVLFAALTLPLAYAVSKIGALFYYDPRPFVAGHYVPLIPHEPDNGFPSDHVLLCASIAAVVYPSSKGLSLTLGAHSLSGLVARLHRPSPPGGHYRQYCDWNWGGVYCLPHHWKDEAIQ